jgi:hypothetical protein
MKSTIPLLLLVIFLSCSNTASEKETGSKNNSPAKNENPANDVAKAVSIKIFKDDKLVVEYKALFPEGGIVTYKTGEKEIILKLSSDDNTYNLIATLENTSSGNYSIGKPGLGQASLQLTTEGKGPVPFLTNLTEGTFNISLSGESCSGSFTGSQKEPGMNTFRITGDFTSIPLIKQNSNY